MPVSIQEINDFYDNDNVLYHYTNAETAITKILYNKKLRLSPLSKMNDPMEFKDPLQMLGSDFEIERTDIFRIFKEIEEARKNRMERVRLACFSIDDIKNSQTYTAAHHYKGWARSRMWAQYSANHKGVCLVFRKDKLIQSIEAELKKRRLKAVKLLSKKITYSNDVKEYQSAYSLNININNVKDDYTNFYLKNKDQFLFQKLEDYRDEQEFRVLLLNENSIIRDSEFTFSILESLEGIIVGCDFEYGYYANLKEHYEKGNISCYRIEWEYGTPRLYSIFG